MTAFLAVTHLDTFELVASLRTRLGLFQQEAGGASVCPVRQLKGEKWVRPPYAASGKWPELTSVIQRISRLGDQMNGIEFGPINLELLPAGACMNWRVGRNDPPEHEYAIMLLRTSPEVTFFAGREIAMPGIGILTIVAHRLPCSAINMGESAAIWLAVHFRRRQPPLPPPGAGDGGEG